MKKVIYILLFLSLILFAGDGWAENFNTGDNLAFISFMLFAITIPLFLLSLISMRKKVIYPFLIVLIINIAMFLLGLGISWLIEYKKKNTPNIVHIFDKNQIYNCQLKKEQLYFHSTEGEILNFNMRYMLDFKLITFLTNKRKIGFALHNAETYYIDTDDINITTVGGDTYEFYTYYNNIETIWHKKDNHNIKGIPSLKKDYKVVGKSKRGMLYYRSNLTIEDKKLANATNALIDRGDKAIVIYDKYQNRELGVRKFKKTPKLAYYNPYNKRNLYLVYENKPSDIYLLECDNQSDYIKAQNIVKKILHSAIRPWWHILSIPCRGIKREDILKIENIYKNHKNITFKYKIETIGKKLYRVEVSDNIKSIGKRLIFEIDLNSKAKVVSFKIKDNLYFKLIDKIKAIGDKVDLSYAKNYINAIKELLTRSNKDSAIVYRISKFCLEHRDKKRIIKLIDNYYQKDKSKLESALNKEKLEQDRLNYIYTHTVCVDGASRDKMIRYYHNKPTFKEKLTPEALYKIDSNTIVVANSSNRGVEIWKKVLSHFRYSHKIIDNPKNYHITDIWGTKDIVVIQYLYKDKKDSNHYTTIVEIYKKYSNKFKKIVKIATTINNAIIKNNQIILTGGNITVLDINNHKISSYNSPIFSIADLGDNYFYILDRYNSKLLLLNFNTKKIEKIFNKLPLFNKLFIDSSKKELFAISILKEKVKIYKYNIANIKEPKLLNTTTIKSRYFSSYTSYFSKKYIVLYSIATKSFFIYNHNLEIVRSMNYSDGMSKFIVVDDKILVANGANKIVELNINDF